MTIAERRLRRPAPILELIDVHAAYGRIEVLRGVDLAVPRGAVMALLGANGAGKTTLLRVISGLMPLTSGDIHLGGVHVADATPDQLTRAGLTMVPEGRGIFPNLTVEENLWISSYSGRQVEKILADAYARFPRLKERRRQLAGSLSGGEQQMLSLGRALASEPALLLLDELSMGLAPLIVESLYDSVAEIAEQGVSILVVEQFAKSALRVADYAAVMHGGRIVDSGEPDEIEGRLNELYFGGAA
ncbi:MAG TPA: ABC transporter ATP-binding protein [Jatrophihabitans sp.]|jgi:branched-chain amino acid transport system ATP-binding protein|nr:ABC transporter ATP-binding protein [Jatrophihabitans sp.]